MGFGKFLKSLDITNKNSFLGKIAPVGAAFIPGVGLTGAAALGAGIRGVQGGNVFEGAALGAAGELGQGAIKGGMSGFKTGGVTGALRGAGSGLRTTAAPLLPAARDAGGLMGGGGGGMSGWLPALGAVSGAYEMAQAEKNRNRALELAQAGYNERAPLRQAAIAALRASPRAGPDLTADFEDTGNPYYRAVSRQAAA